MTAGAVDLLLLSEKLDKRRIFIECAQCHRKEEKTVNPVDVDKIKDSLSQCPDCKSSQYSVVEEKDLIENLGDQAEAQGTHVQLLSKETEEGEQLFSTFGGITALLRFQMG